MRSRRWTLVMGAVLLVALRAGGALASSAPPTFAIPGFAAKGLQVEGVSRLNDGGALIAGSLNDKAHTPDWHPLVLRLRFDGSPDLAYGSDGITTLRLGTDIRSTSLAIDPQSGDAWVGLGMGGGEGMLVALNGSGAVRSRFGHDGIVGLGAANAVALAWRAGELLVASGSQPCLGCQLTLINPTTGSTIARATLTPSVAAGGTGCVGGSITSAVLLDPHTAQLAFSGARVCTAQLITVAISDETGHRSLQSTTTTPLGATATAGRVSAFGPDVCVAASSPTSTEFGPFLVGTQGFAPRRAPGGRLVAIVTLGHGACAALITNDQNPGGLVTQATPGLQNLTRDVIPRSVQSLGMFRCHGHLLVIGARARNRVRRGVIVVVPVRQGPDAATASVAVAEKAPARCR